MSTEQTTQPFPTSCWARSPSRSGPAKRCKHLGLGSFSSGSFHTPYSAFFLLDLCRSEEGREGSDGGSALLRRRSDIGIFDLSRFLDFSVRFSLGVSLTLSPCSFPRLSVGSPSFGASLGWRLCFSNSAFAPSLPLPGFPGAWEPDDPFGHFLANCC